jgi:DNA-binding PadR family transcriptional regulator
MTDPVIPHPRTGGSELGPKQLADLGRYTGPATLVLSSLAGGAKHGYALTKDIEQFADVHLAPGTLYGVLARMVDQGLIEPVASDDERRRPYCITPAGTEALRTQLSEQRRVADIGLRRLGGAMS